MLRDNRATVTRFGANFRVVDPRAVTGWCTAR
jgi:hypothetical protein